MGSPVKQKKRVILSRQSLPALSFIVLGVAMMAMPFIVEHSGYIGDAMIATDEVKPPFDKTMILIGQESLEGSIGIILNKPLTPSQHAKLSPFLRDSGIPVGYGGPLEVTEKIFVLEETKLNSKTQEPDLNIQPWDDAVRTTPDLLDKIRQDIKKGKQHYRLFTGYTAWSTFQLAEETLLKHKWHALSATHDMVFQSNPESEWDALNHQEKAKESPLNQI